MTNEQLVYEIQQGHDRKHNLEQLYNQNRGLIAKAARRLSVFAEMDDLTQEGYIALQEAADQYDPKGGASFATYAFEHIYRSLQNYLRDNQHLIHFSADMSAKVMKYKRISEVYSKTTGEPVTKESLAVLLNVSHEQAAAIIQAARMTALRSLSAPVPGTEDMTLEDCVPDQTDQIGQLTDALSDQKVNRQLWECVEKLGKRKAKILREHYQERRTLSSIAEDVGVSPERIRQEHAAAIRSLRRMKAVRKISEHYNFYFGTTAALFRRTWTSQQEFYVMRLEELESYRLTPEEPPSELCSESPERHSVE